MASHRTAKNISAEIHSAFHAIEKPQHETFEIARIRSKGNVLTPIEARYKQSPNRWQDIPARLLRRDAPTLDLVGSEALRFVLPAYLCFALNHPGAEDSKTISHLFGILLIDDWHKLWILDCAQRKAVLSFMTFFAKTPSRKFQKEARAALKLWRRPLKLFEVIYYNDSSDADNGDYIYLVRALDFQTLLAFVSQNINRSPHNRYAPHYLPEVVTELGIATGWVRSFDFLRGPYFGFGTTGGGITWSRQLDESGTERWLVSDEKNPSANETLPVTCDLPRYSKASPNPS
jgi:hypothetical protein